MSPSFLLEPTLIAQTIEMMMLIKTTMIAKNVPSGQLRINILSVYPQKLFCQFPLENFDKVTNITKTEGKRSINKSGLKFLK